MKCLRTDDARFTDLPEFDFEPRYLDVDDTEGGRLRLHYIDEGSHPGELILCMHGEPTWCFLYRRMVKLFVARGYRVIVPDLIGFGRSDKPTRREDHTYRRHVGWMKSALEQLAMRNVTLVCQDWGGLIGLRLVAENPERFRRVVTANTRLPTGDDKPSETFLQWRQRSQAMATFPAGRLISTYCAAPLSEAVIAGYDAPFPDESFKEGPRQLPLLVPISPDDPEHLPNKRAWEVLRNFDRPWLTAFSDGDPFTRHGEKVFQRRVKGAAGRAHVTIENAGHFLQEDKPAEFARAVVEFMEAT
jgi:haloalkane dehalogenase